VLISIDASRDASSDAASDAHPEAGAADKQVRDTFRAAEGSGF